MAYTITAFVLAIGSCFLAHNAVAQVRNDEDAQCLERCLTTLQQNAPGLDAAKILSLGHITTDNQTMMCPRYDTQVMITSCRAYQEAATCLTKCPDGPLKTLSTSGFSPLQLICIDRKDDFGRYMPCLSENCPSVAAVCSPKCGSFDDLSRDVLQLLRQIRGPGLSDQPTNARVDPNNMTMIIDKACEAIQCYVNCSRDPITSKCGKDAYSLEMQTMWTVFASMTQSMSSIGISAPCPESCRNLYATSATWTKSVVTGRPGPVVTDREDQTQTTKSNSVDQFVQKAIPQNDEANKNGTEVPTPKCQGPACGASSATSASIFLMTVCAALLVFE